MKVAESGVTATEGTAGAQFMAEARAAKAKALAALTAYNSRT